MKDAVFLPDDDITSIKQAILNYGSVSAGIAVEKCQYMPNISMTAANALIMR